MNKLKAIINEYGRWSDLDIYVERIEAHIVTDFSHSLENAKALLETIGKEICKANNTALNPTASINSVMKKAFTSMGYGNSNLVNQVSSALATIGQQVGELRNDIGLTSHGKTLEEVKQRNNKVDVLTRDFLIDTVELISVFLIRNFEGNQSNPTPAPLKEALEYSKAEDFNESWDETFEEFVMGAYSFPASEVLFNVDKQAYVNEYNAFKEADV